MNFVSKSKYSKQDYKTKYIKYKAKYENLKKTIHGGDNDTPTTPTTPTIPTTPQVPQTNQTNQTLEQNYNTPTNPMTNTQNIMTPSDTRRGFSNISPILGEESPNTMGESTFDEFDNAEFPTQRPTLTRNNGVVYRDYGSMFNDDDSNGFDSTPPSLYRTNTDSKNDVRKKLFDDEGTKSVETENVLLDKTKQVGLNLIINNIANNYAIKNKGESITLYYRVIDGKKDFSYMDENLGKVDMFDQLFYNKKKLLIHNAKPFFIFHNDDINERDRGIDAGGLTKITFHEISKYISEKFFVIDNDAKYYSFNTSFDIKIKENKEKIIFLGELFGLAIKLGNTIQINLNPFILYQIAHTINIDRLCAENIINIVESYKPFLLNSNNLLFACYNSEKAKKLNMCLYNEDGTEIKLENMSMETTNKIRIMLKEQKTITEYFIEGFRNQINVVSNEIYNLSLNNLDTLIAGINITTRDLFYKHLNYINFKPDEKIHMQIIIDYYICKEGEQEYLQLLLITMTGTNRIPGLGFPIYPLCFELDSQIMYNRPVEIHTCFNQFKINDDTKNGIFPKNLSVSDHYTMKSEDREKLPIYGIFSPESLKLLSQDLTIG